MVDGGLGFGLGWAIPMTDDAKYRGNPRQSMWEPRNWPEQGITVYRSSWHWQPD